MKKKNTSSLEKTLGYVFKDMSHLERALTHSSSVSSPKHQIEEIYQRHEFLGDRVLALTIADMLLEAFPKADEGELARRLNGLVRNETCAAVAQDLKVGSFIRLGEGEIQAGGYKKDAILGDVCEAIIGAIFLDGGFEQARDFISRNWKERMLNWKGPLRDAKTTLQEWVQGRKLPPPLYSQVSRKGPDHAPEFILKCEVEGMESIFGNGPSKRIAEQNAARAMLIREAIWNEDGEPVEKAK
ncbi:ribonuclease III [Cohaesibacter gelatinilyticus]|uniref:Ribonuclease 3 n=1 Tax=Cohaesibacter gelatinilyticus TaxID=372072 RepID=A0A285NEE2_9HYPH|nr:ribonuclease III [Cohaesibacter gelatinilyticus]SNZ07327.1 RNAse III [Cohaesibacter gelatinilyticus]HAT87433.1 ribonuclease III [Hyphomicrobiales bacterium]